MKVDFAKLNSAVRCYAMTPEKKEWEKCRQLFVDITEKWETEEDIDYSIPISTLVELIENTAILIGQQEEFIEALEGVSERIDNSRPVRLRPRLL